MGQVDIEAAANALFANLTALLTESGITLPARSGIVPGALVAFDDAQFTLAWLGIQRGQAGQVSAPEAAALLPGETIIYYEFQVDMLRITPTVSGQGRQGGIPSATALAASFSGLAADASALTNAIIAIHTGYLVADYGVPFWWGPVSSVGPEGALAGCRLPIQFMAGMAADGTY